MRIQTVLVLIRRYTLPLAVAASVVALDLFTKRFAAINFADADVVVIPGFLSFTFLENPGAAFSMFQNGGQVIGVAAILVSIGLIYTLRLDRPRGEQIGLALILGGALGNLIDRIARGDGLLDGPVIDWVRLWWIPTFNVADASITIAVVVLLLVSWRISRSPSNS